jgi:hypothetical protein
MQYSFVCCTVWIFSNKLCVTPVRERYTIFTLSTFQVNAGIPLIYWYYEYNLCMSYSIFQNNFLHIFSMMIFVCLS